LQSQNDPADVHDRLPPHTLAVDNEGTDRTGINAEPTSIALLFAISATATSPTATNDGRRYDGDPIDGGHRAIHPLGAQHARNAIEDVVDAHIWLLWRSNDRRP